MTRTWLVLVAALAVAAAACGSLREGPAGTGGCEQGDPNCVPVTAGSAGACLAGDPGCEDIPGTTGPAASPPGSGAVPVAEAVAAGIDGPFAISGYYVDDGSGPRLCEALAESFPPQCGGANRPLDAGGAVVDGLQTDQAVTWSDRPVEVEGEIVAGTFVARVAE